MTKSYCNCCGKIRKDVISWAKGYNVTPNMCFLCRKEAERGKYWSYNENRYVKYSSYYWE